MDFRLCRSILIALISGTAIVSFTSASTALAQSPDRLCLAKKLRDYLSDIRGKFTRESAVEMEITVSPRVMDLITTTTGTVRPIVEGAPKHYKDPQPNLPESLVSWVKQNAPELTDPLDAPWDRLPYELKIQVINHASYAQEFRISRKIAGLVTRKEARLHFFRKTEFLGKTYEPGYHLVDVSGFLQSHVEFATPEDPRDLQIIELHFRGKRSAGSNSVDAWTLLSGMRIPKYDQHVHMTGLIPYFSLRKYGETKVDQMTDFFRRANLLALMNSIAERAEIFQDHKFFGHLSRDYLKGFQADLQAIASGRENEMMRDSKLSLFAHRPSRIYDSPGLLGFEFRAISYRTDPKIMRRILDRLQRSLMTSDFGPGLPFFDEWSDDLRSKNVFPAMEDQWFDRGVGYTLARTNNPDISRLYHEVVAATKSDLFERHLDLKMLLHDWRYDPLFFRDPAARDRILRAQIEGLKLLRDGAEYWEVSQRFIVDSGLLESVCRSFGLDDLPKAIIQRMKKI